jgi:hypothetical protein
VSRPLRLYGLLELCIGACGLLLVPGFHLLEALDGRLYGLVPGAATLSFPVAQLLVFGTGFVTFGLEIAWFRALRTAFWSTSTRSRSCSPRS